MRRIALLSDIHGNLPALDAVLAGIETVGIEERYCLGDLVGYGPDPEAVIDRVRSLGLRTVRGNYDLGVGGLTGDCGCYFATEEDAADGAASYEFTTGVLSHLDRAWLYSLPDDIRLAHGSARILLVHGSPRRIDERLTPEWTDESLAQLALEAGADVICVGHTHQPHHRSVPLPPSAVHFVNAGSVGKPQGADTRACWVELVLGTEEEVREGALGDPARGPAGLSGVFVGALIRRIAYDVEKVAKRMTEVGLPPALVEALRGG